ncbi:rubrerythrin-like domain-containing protein [Natronocalculus amylovorans]|uniref:Rubrerythrin-like domain-containing protein n=1 Tax=Natronocalculus amylovorans TaxID=2917812 RepID=A0AAE3FXS6_9EURY|nr:rubrerythrin-like domain-containing protein [Natronocalculus amylovorans]MCL9817343.1 rubrerythrin-like domain-containing protein [Natronocalculus amylovorans]NUE02630.1 rubrerythrin-like domain-containing protein [Halorubraceae archaeon YAN]
MNTNHADIDPYTPSTGYYECVSCTYREHRTDSPGTCPHCGDTVRNIAVSRE